MQEHMNQFQKTFIMMAAEYTQHVRREIDAANKKADSEKDGEDMVIHLGRAPVTLEDKVRTANLLMVTIDRMRRENGDRVPFGDLHVEVAKPESVARGDALRSCMTKMFNAWAAESSEARTKMEKIIVSQEFLNQQLDRAQGAAHILTSMGAMSKRDTLAFQLLADLCRALRNPLIEDPAPVDQQRLALK